MSGNDVRVLQVLLNNDSRTMVADIGPGSKSLETTYFGTKTTVAVVKFQNLYRSEVLSPAGLTQGTGFVGLFTRTKVLALCDALFTPAPLSASVPQTVATSSGTVTSPATPKSVSVPTVPSPVPSPAGEQLQLNRPDRYVVSPGDRVSIAGSGFSATGNTLHVGAFTISDVAQYTLGTLEVVLPVDAPKGKFDLLVSNTAGESNKRFLVVVEKGTVPPAIGSFSPKSGANGTVVSVTGSGFTKENNEVYFGNKPATGVASSDGKTLTFTLSMGFDGMPLGQSGQSTTTAPIWFYVVNANGISNNGVFTLTF